MTEQEFFSRMAQAEDTGGLSARPGYYEGYMRGLRRFYHGPHFGTLKEHEEWLVLVYDRDQTKADRGRGYQHGLQGIRPLVMSHSPTGERSVS
jgi:hypothetical protein